MSENYSIKINRVEGTVEIVGDDKDWVAARLQELKGIYNNPDIESKKAAQESPNPTAQAPVETLATPPRKSKRGGGISLRSQKNPELTALLTKEIKNKLDNFVQERRTQFDKSLPAQAAIIATFLQDEFEREGVDHNDMYTIYSVMGWPAPGNPKAQLNNALSRNQYFGGVSEGKYILSHKGENYARHQSKEVAE